MRSLKRPPKQKVSTVRHCAERGQRLSVPLASQVHRVATRKRQELPVFSFCKWESLPAFISRVPRGAITGANGCDIAQETQEALHPGLTGKHFSYVCEKGIDTFHTG